MYENVFLFLLCTTFVTLNVPVCFVFTEQIIDLVKTRCVCIYIYIFLDLVVPLTDYKKFCEHNF